MKKLFLIGMILLTGCAHVQKGEILKEAPALVKGEYLEQVFISEDFKPASMTLQIKEPNIQGLPTNEKLSPSEAQDQLGYLLENHLRGVNGIKVARDSEAPTYILETAITDLEPGNAFLRWVIGWGLAGSSTVQVEGKIINAEGKPLLIFADRRAGSAAGGYDLTGGDSREMLLADMSGIAQALANTLKDQMLLAAAEEK